METKIDHDVSEHLIFHFQAESRAAHDGAETTTVLYEFTKTTTEALETTSPPTAEEDTGSSNLSAVIPVSILFLALLVIVLCIRYHIHSASYKSLVKRLRRNSQRRDEDEESVDEEMFKPPPEYQMAVKMPRPCRCADDCPKAIMACRQNSENQCNTPAVAASTAAIETEIETDLSDSSEPHPSPNKNTTDCKCECHSEEDSGVGFKPVNDKIQPNCVIDLTDSREACIVTINADNSDSPDIHHGPFLILEHVQRMTRNPEFPASCLPSYQEYIEEFPEDTF